MRSDSEPSGKQMVWKRWIRTEIAGVQALDEVGDTVIEAESETNDEVGAEGVGEIMIARLEVMIAESLDNGSRFVIPLSPLQPFLSCFLVTFRASGSHFPCSEPRASCQHVGEGKCLSLRVCLLRLLDGPGTRCRYAVHMGRRIRTVLEEDSRRTLPDHSPMPSKPSLGGKKAVYPTSQPRIQRGLIRHTFLLLDGSHAMNAKDFAKTYNQLAIPAIIHFVYAFFDQNPISQLGIILLQDEVAKQISPLSQNPADHITALQQIQKDGAASGSGDASLENGLELAKHVLNTLASMEPKRSSSCLPH